MENEIVFPVKLYRLGETVRTVNAKPDLDYYLGEGWSYTPQVYEHKDFPRVIYHAAEGSKTVKTVGELEEHIKAGWETVPRKYSVAESIKSKIMFHNAELERFQMEYKNMTGEFVIVGIYGKEEEPEMTEEKPQDLDIEINEPLMEKKKRGRKPKEKG